MVYDSQQRFITVNEEAEMLYGLRLEALIGQCDDGLASPLARQIAPLLAQLGEAHPQISATLKLCVHDRLELIDVVYRRIVDPCSGVGTFGLLRPRQSEDAQSKALSFGRELRVDHRGLALHTNDTPLGCIEWDAQGRIAGWSSDAQAIFGWTSAEVMGKRFSDFPFVFEDDLPVAALLAEELRTSSHSGRITVYRNYSKTGSVIHCRWYNARIPDPSAHRALSLVEDITAYVRAQSRVEENEARLQALITQQQERIRALYQVAASKGDSPEEQILATLEMGRTAFDLPYAFLNSANESTLTIEYALCADADMAGIKFPLELTLGRHVIHNGGVLAIENLSVPPWNTDVTLEDINWLSYMCAPLTVSGKVYGTIAFASPSPRTQSFTEADRDLLHLMSALIAGALERKIAQDRVTALTHSDMLTGLPNRFGLRGRLEQTIAMVPPNQKLALLLLDIDRFKDINDTYGQQIGDVFLLRIAERIRHCVRGADIVARISGDQFMIALANVDSTKMAGELARKLLGEIDNPIIIDGADIFATATIGISVFPDDSHETDSLLKCAEIALHRAKDAGRNLYQFYATTMNAQTGHRLALERRLREALRREEFEIYYQPQFHLQTGRIDGVEALVRWRQADGTLMLPHGFITLSEKTGLIVQLGEWVLQTACRQVRYWQQRMQPDLQLAVNLSGRQFYQPELISTIREALRESGLRPQSLEIEITESVAMQDAPQTVAVMRDLKDAGVLLSVDDFGTGYSSLSYLRLFPLDNLKIDRSFVSDIAIDSGDAMIVQTIIAMAHALQLNVIAEGVETIEQLAFLRDSDCDYAQGNYFAPALCAAEFEALIRKKQVAV